MYRTNLKYRACTRYGSRRTSPYGGFQVIEHATFPTMLPTVYLKRRGKGPANELKWHSRMSIGRISHRGGVWWGVVGPVALRTTSSVVHRLIDTGQTLDWSYYVLVVQDPFRLFPISKPELDLAQWHLVE